MSVAILLADGVRPDTLAAAMHSGTLPALAQLRDEGALHVVTSCFPSVTGPAYAPFLMGRFPGPVGLPGLRWYDRARTACTFPDYSRSYVGYQMSAVDRDIAALGNEFAVDSDWIAAEVDRRGSFQIVHLPSLTRIDIFVPEWTGLHLWKWEQRRRIALGEPPSAHIDVTSPEGIILQKLVWYRDGGMPSGTGLSNALEFRIDP